VPGWPGGSSNKGCYELLIKSEKMLRAVTITSKCSGTIELVHGVIKGMVGLS
jgi:hypothetical protein